MKLTKIIIENFKSINKMEFDIKRHGHSYTTILVGLNESGKSNILQAMSYLSVPEKDFIYEDMHNQKDDDNNPISLKFQLEFEGSDTPLHCLNEKIVEGKELLSKIEINAIVKSVDLQHADRKFTHNYDYQIVNLPDNLFVKTTQEDALNNSGQASVEEKYVIKEIDEGELNPVNLTMESFRQYFGDEIESAIEMYEPRVSFWQPSEQYLISEEDLNEFLKDIDQRPALKNIFTLAGYNDEEKIKNQVEGLINGQKRSKLVSIIQSKLNTYIREIWHHGIDIVVDITETGKLTLSIKDTGKANEHDRLPITGRSEGARHFMSLLLSLSIENTNRKRKNELILIDEPEIHLHPAGIRDMRTELLRIGVENYVFTTTHSPFLVDRMQKSRNIIIKKNNYAFTDKIEISDHTSLIDDEVLREAFGIEVYRDLLNPHSLLVEGASDKVIIQKAFMAKGIEKYGVTNSHGSNVVTLAAKLMDTGIPISIVLDDDEDGKGYREKIIKLGRPYNTESVFTIRDLVGDIKAGGTIEDTLGSEFVISAFKKYYEQKFDDKLEFNLTEEKPYIAQITEFFYKLGSKMKKETKDSMVLELKKNMSEDLTLNLGNIKKFPLLAKLIDAICEKVN